MAKKKFTDGENPVLQFISTPQEEKEIKTDASVSDIPEGFKLVPETKSKRVNLVLRPNVHQKGVERAKQEGLSFSDYVHQLIEKDIEKL